MFRARPRRGATVNLALAALVLVAMMALPAALPAAGPAAAPAAGPAVAPAAGSTALPAVEPAPQDPSKILRPIPGPLVPPAFFQQAIENGTRTPTGEPGPRYWQTWADYDIDVRLDPRTALLSGRESVAFMNRSPDELPYLMLHLHQNIHAPGAVRMRPNEITGGVRIGRVAVNGEELFEVSSEEDAGYRVLGALLRVQLPAPVAAGAEAVLKIDWSFVVPQSGSGRMGHSDREMYYMGYWFPKIGVYDDLRGWDADPYTGGAEFYDSFGDYRVNITVPAGWTVMGTGTLQNPAEVLSAQTRERLAEAAASDAVIQVATPADRSDDKVTLHPDSGALTYRFTAESVRDYTFTASDVQTWSATSAVVPDRDGDGAPDRVAIHSFWREQRAPLWAEQARYAKHAIEFLSRETGLAYPWPHMTSVEGDDIIGGGMEFPNLTLIGAYRERGADALYGVTLHELAHMWTPLTIGSNEKRHAWMDEGWATYLTNRGRLEFFADDPPDSEAESRDSYLEVAREAQEGMMMQHGDYYEVGYGTASYAKPATLLVTLRNLLGDEVFGGGVRTYFQEWAFKHPSPWDFFNTLERAAGRDLDWFWSSWYHETWRLDQAVGGVQPGAGGPRITIDDHGFAPMPATVRIETSKGGTLTREIPVSHWLAGNVEYLIELPESAGEVTAVIIDPEELYPDVDRSNNVWPREDVGR